jgi:hypothetical protein
MNHSGALRISEIMPLIAAFSLDSAAFGDKSHLQKDRERFNGWTSIYRHSAIRPEELHSLREFAYVSYHLRPRYLWRFLQSIILHPLLFPELKLPARN